MEQFDKLLTCAICLDRYRNPKLLPCQHTFCMEPCLEGLVDYVRRQVKCPECRAEHRVTEISNYPTNFTLVRFLQLYSDISGDLPPVDQTMERCQICSEKSVCTACNHCNGKRLCSDCKEAHLDVLKREIQRITNQVKRVLNRLEDTISVVDKNTKSLTTNSLNVIDEIDDVYRRLSKALKDRSEYLKHEVERYVGQELRQLSTFRSNLEQEVANIQSNCELVEKYMVNENGIEWPDLELMDTKDVFLKTMEFIRNFEYEPGDYARRIKFSSNVDPNKLVMDLGSFADVHIPPLSQTQNLLSTLSQPGLGGSTTGQGALMRSKSDHRLTTQFRNMNEDEDSCNSYGSSGRKFGEPRHVRQYGQEEESAPGGDRKSRFRSRFTRHLESSFEEPEPSQGGRVRFEQPQKERDRVLDTDDASKGPMSGITRLFDSPKVIERVAESERPKKPAPMQPAAVVVQKVAATTPATPWRTTSRQLSEDDEIAKQKKANKEEKVEKASAGTTRRQTSNEPKTPSHTEMEHLSELPSQTSQGSQQQETGQSRARKLSVDRFPKKRSESEDSGSTSESATSSNSVGTGALFSIEDVKQRFMNKSDMATTGSSANARKDSSGSGTSSAPARNGGTRYQNRYLSTSKQTPEKKVEPSKEVDEEEEEESSEEEIEETESEEESDSSPPVPPVKKPEPAKTTTKMDKTDIGPLLARSANARDKERGDSASSTNTTSSYTPRQRQERSSPTTATTSSVSSYRRREKSPPVRETEAPSRYSSTSGTTASSSTAGMGSSRYPSSYTSNSDNYTTPSGLARSRTGTSLYSDQDSGSSRYSSGLASKYLNRSRHNFDDHDPAPSSSSTRYSGSSNPSSSLTSAAPLTRRSYLSKNTPSSTGLEHETSKSSRLTSIKDRRAKINRSKSSHDVLTGIDFSKDDDEELEPESPTRSAYTNYQRRKSINTTDPPNSDESSQLSNWARYLKNKYGKDRQQPPAQTPRSPAEDLQKFSFPSNPYMNKNRFQFKFGSRGSEAGHFTWPRGISTGPDGHVYVADSSNHRCQIFEPNGDFIKEIGSYGNSEGEFDCLAGVCVNRIGQLIVSDRYNHRLQIFDPSGRFLRAFGGQGSGDGKFQYPWGVATDVLGFIYVCDKDNHRIQVFQSDGTFVGKFGSLGSGLGNLDNPSYIAVSSSNKVIVTDTNNHRLAIFDVNGRALSTIGSEGSENGQFKLPRGVALEDGFIIVGDSGNNRIVILSPDGTFLKSFGSYGSGDMEFKGLEGVAVWNGNLYVVDRENHRIICVSLK